MGLTNKLYFSRSFVNSEKGKKNCYGLSLKLRSIKIIEDNFLSTVNRFNVLGLLYLHKGWVVLCICIS